MNPFLEKMLLDQGPLSKINFGIVPVHDNPYPPAGNKGIHWEVGIILCNFIKAKKPEQIIELGTFRGYSTSWLILGTLLAGAGRVDAYEIFPEGAYGPMLYDRYGLPKDRFSYHQIPCGIWRHEIKLPKQIDLLYHDTDHLPIPTRKEMELLLPRIPIGGMVIVDDMLHPHYGQMQFYLNGLFSLDTNWKWNILPIGCGLGIAERMR